MTLRYSGAPNAPTSNHCHDRRYHARGPEEVYSGRDERFHCQTDPEKRTGGNARPVVGNDDLLEFDHHVEFNRLYNPWTA
jgi:hypothetical protein